MKNLKIRDQKPDIDDFDQLIPEESIDECMSPTLPRFSSSKHIHIRKLTEISLSDIQPKRQRFTVAGCRE